MEEVTIRRLAKPIEGRIFRQMRPSGVLMALATAILFAAAILSATQGAVGIPATTILEILLSRIPLVGEWLGISPYWPAAHEAVVLQIRLPRVGLAAMVGASLSVAGATYQGMFRNPLADPYLIGVASGAGLGGVLALVLPLSPVLYALGIVQWAAFASALVTMLVVYLLARVGSTVPVTTLLLAGVALGAFASAGTSFLMFMNQEKLSMAYSWLLGGFSLGNWQQVLLTLPYVALGCGIIFLHARLLNVLQLDEEQAAQLGVNVERLKLVLVISATLVTASAVSVSGLIGFVGLIIPHAVRLLWGPDYRLLLPMSTLVGGTYLVLADTVARTVLAPTEIPVGVITAFCGAPFFLYLLRQRKRMVF